MSHTPTHWYRSGIYVTDGAGFVIAGFHRLGDTDAQVERVKYAVRAVNSHEALIEACRHVLAIENFHSLDSVKYGDTPIRVIVQAALALAEKEQP